MSNTNSRVYVAGHRGLVGSAIVKKLESQGYTNIITRTSSELDLINQQAVADFFAKEKPEDVYLLRPKSVASMPIIPTVVNSYIIT